MTDHVVMSLATVPDIDALRLIHQFDELSDEGVLSAALHLHHQRHGNKNLPLYQQQIVSVVAVKYMESGELALHGFDNDAENELERLVRLNEFVGTAKQIISWEMNSFDLPLMNYRLLKHTIISANFYAAAKVDLSECLSSIREDKADLAGLSKSIGLPDIDSMTQQDRIECFLSKQMQSIHTANQSKLLNSYFIHLRHRLVSAELASAEYEAAREKLFEALRA